MSLEFSRIELDTLLGLDHEVPDPDEHAVFGYAHASWLRLEGDYGRPVALRDVQVIGVHRSDDQSQALPGGLDLEFETSEGDYVVDFGELVQKRLAILAKGWGTVVLALCNPDRVQLGSFLEPLQAVLSGPLYWAYGDVQAGIQGPEGPYLLQAERWFRRGA